MECGTFCMQSKCPATEPQSLVQLEEEVQALVRRFYALQSERVEAYHLFEEGHRAYLRSGPAYDFARYRQLVHEITQAFSGISRDILQIKGQLEGPHGRPDLAQHLGRIQEKEKEKLELTAQLQLAKQNAQDHPGVEAHAQEVREVKHNNPEHVDPRAPP
ncbi:required for excision 1-B domain-containing protein isoform X2 [Rhineura floridana]|uniref:required for excision 1-B domain-containing protein isoform X2 n=1 Tax=Rhineura floridana TaxID=261503 RepID=UPI002AC872C5|nr:required for excision 1-B domain-containing protein isoform X2 [Rhineura floridana]